VGSDGKLGGRGRQLTEDGWRTLGELQHLFFCDITDFELLTN